MCLASANISTHYIGCNVVATLRPTDIRFSKNEISSFFGKGWLDNRQYFTDRKIHDVIDDVKRGILNVRSFPPIKVFVQKYQWRAKNNRRLYMMRVLEVEDFVDFVQVQVIRERRHLELRDDGQTIKFQGGFRTRRHRRKYWCFPRFTFARCIGAAVALFIIIVCCVISEIFF